jgi:hypothetical protein
VTLLVNSPNPCANIPNHSALLSNSGYANGKKQEMWCPLPTSSVAKGGKEVRSAFASAREPNTVEPSDDQVCCLTFINDDSNI